MKLRTMLPIAFLLFGNTCQSSESLYTQSLKKTVDLIEKAHSIKHVQEYLTNLPLNIQLDIIYYILLASKVFTLKEREQILTNFLTNTGQLISETDRHNLQFIKKEFIDALKVLHKGPRVSYLVAGPNAQLCTKKTTLLIKAAANGNVSLIERLISLGANPNMQDFEGHSPLFYSKNLSVAQLLLVSGAKINLPDNNGNTVIFLEDDPAILAYYINNGANLKHLNNDGLNALGVHASQNEIAAAKLLLKAGVPINQVNRNNQTLFDILEDDINVKASTIDFLIINGALTADELNRPRTHD